MSADSFLVGKVFNGKTTVFLLFIIKLDNEAVGKRVSIFMTLLLQ